jgi:hypothetical protein
MLLLFSYSGFFGVLQCLPMASDDSTRQTELELVDCQIALGLIAFL